MADEVNGALGGRGWWRGAGAVVIGVGGLLLGRVVWGMVAERMLEGEVRGIQQRGEVVRPGDFDPGRVVDPARNGAVLLGRAAGMVVYTPAENRWAAGFTGRLPLSGYDAKVLGGIATANARSLKLVREARVAGMEVDWGLSMREPAWWGTGAWRPVFSADRDLGALLCNLALYEQAGGRSGEALELVRDALYLSRALEEKGPLTVAHVSAVGVATLACQVVDQIAPMMPGEERGRVREVMGELLEEGSLKEGLVRGLRGKRMYDLAVAEHVGKLAFRGAGYWALRPMLVLDTRRAVRADSAVIEAAGAGTYPVAAGRIPPAVVSQAMPHLAQVTRSYSGMVRGNPDALLRAHYLHLLDRRFAAVALAVRMYRVEHGGRWPERLGELVPGYLAGVPGDSMAREGREIAYGVRGGKRVLYSVGVNGVDEGGDGRPYNPRYPSAPRTMRFDVVYPLGDEGE